MGFFDFITGLFGGKKDEPEPPPSPEKLAEVRAAWTAALASGDWHEGLSAAQGLSDGGRLHDEAVAAMQQLIERFPEHHGDTAQYIATTLYLGKAGYRETVTDAEKAAIYEESLRWYETSVKAGESTFGGLNYFEMCEWLAENDFEPRAKEWLGKYKSLYPKGEELERVETLLASLQPEPS